VCDVIVLKERSEGERPRELKKQQTNPQEQAQPQKDSAANHPPISPLEQSEKSRESQSHPYRENLEYNEKLREYQQRYRGEHREKLREQNRRRYQELKEQSASLTQR
jgi:hypothetical protein